MLVDVYVLTIRVLSLFPILIIGYTMRKIGLFNKNSMRTISDLILYLSQPFLIINSIVKISFSVENLKTGLLSIAISAGVHVVLSITALAAAIPFKNMDKKKIIQLGIIFSNCSFLGLPIIGSILGDEGRFWVGFYAIFFNFFFWSYGLIIIGKGRKDIKINLVKVVFNFGTIPCYIGIALFLLRITPPAAVGSMIESLAALATPLSLFLTGGLIASLPLKSLFTTRSIYYTSAIKLIIMPLIILIILKFIGLDARMCIFAMVMAGLPSAANTAMITSHFDIMPEYAAQQIGLMTTLSAFTLPLIVWLGGMIINI